MVIIGIDTGGTFTDFVFQDAQQLRVLKIPSTPHDPSRAILQGLQTITGGSANHIIHGSTVATNAILEHKGAQTAVICNRGFEDILEIGRQNRAHLYDLSYRKPPELVAHNFRYGISGRLQCTGEIFEQPDSNEIPALLHALERNSVAS
ncbi:hydantoinase/oxoprolinase N-terminal domain-containing protein, partial [Thermodesulfobacteriota bacterium]